MSTADSTPREARPLALADALCAWTLQKMAAPELARALALAARAEADGHACARLSELPDDEPTLDLDALRRQAWVGDGSTITPTVLTADGDFFFWRNWRHEQRVSESLLQRIAHAEMPPDSLWQADLDLLYAGMDASHSAGQRLATTRALGKRLFVLSGGPGTGKTSTVLRMLLLQQRVAAARGGRSPSVALAAPTGKAAQRLSQAVRDGKAALQQSLSALPGTSWAAALDAIPESAQTLHRLLGALPAEDRFRHNREQPLPWDIVVVDEASMVDLASMRALLDALADNATLVLVGDPDQLVSVSAGSVLADIDAASAHSGSGFEQHAAHLSHVWRTGSELALAYAAARRGDAPELRQLLERIPGCGIHAVSDPHLLATRVQQWLARPEWSDLHHAARCDDAAATFAALRAQQLLTALRSGPFGAEALNATIDSHWRRANGGAQWYPGRPVLIRNNDYSRRLFNGDIGVAVGRGNNLRIAFETIDANGQPSLRLLQPRELPDFDLAYAITVHKSQGSEYAHVAVLLPPDADSRILSRQLLYTGISRAKTSVELWAAPASLDAALSRVSVRAGGLRQALVGRVLASTKSE